MSDLNRIRLLLSDPLLTMSDVELFERQARQCVSDFLPTCPELLLPQVTPDPKIELVEENAAVTSSQLS